MRDVPGAAGREYVFSKCYNECEKRTIVVSKDVLFLPHIINLTQQGTERRTRRTKARRKPRKLRTPHKYEATEAYTPNGTPMTTRTDE